MAGQISKAEFDSLVPHGYAGRRGEDGMNGPDEHGDVWWMSYDNRLGTILNYGFITDSAEPQDEVAAMLEPAS